MQGANPQTELRPTFAVTWPRPWRVLGVAVIVLLCVAAVLNSAVFAVRRVEVVGARAVPAAQIRALSGVALGTPLLRVNSRQVCQRLLTHPRLANARVDRYWDGRVVLTVTERRASALVAVGADWMVLDQLGTPYALADPREAAQLPILTYEGYTEVVIGRPLRASWVPRVVACLSALAKLPAPIARQVGEIHVSANPDRPVRLYLDSMLAVDLPLAVSEYDRALQLLGAILPQLAEYGAGWILDVGAAGGATLRNANSSSSSPIPGKEMRGERGILS